MPDWIRFTQRAIGKLTGQRELFAFTPEYWGKDGIEPSPLRERQSRLGRRFGLRLFSRTYPGVTGRVHIHDSMLLSDSPEEIAHYIAVGRSAMENLEAALAAAGKTWGKIGACLDMASGYGRVLRLLQTKIDPRRITACDIEEEAVAFLAAEFGVRPIVSEKDLSRLAFPQTYDLIWVGSLFTHLDPPVGLALLETLARALNPRGVLAFSTQGASCLEQIKFYGWMFVPLEGMYREKVAGEGVAYAPYYAQNDPSYGITIWRRDHLESVMSAKFKDVLSQVYFAERGWDKHQDVWAFQKNG